MTKRNETPPPMHKQPKVVSGVQVYHVDGGVFNRVPRAFFPHEHLPIARQVCDHMTASNPGERYVVSCAVTYAN